MGRNEHHPTTQRTRKTHGDFVSGAETFYYLMKPIIDSQLFERNKVAAYAMTMIQAKSLEFVTAMKVFPTTGKILLATQALHLASNLSRSRMF
ncbi:hypothetical protein [Avibacterium paragallinarum]|uniref:hypothetical protein n=1 Tax=Avibacterium paragallinarum TaxID=728 RepID=UPI001FD6F395|nr:hypothetical protein [Avibacterium paragallinarum]